MSNGIEGAIVRTEVGENEFSFFQFAEEIALPSIPPHPLRNCFSLMRSLGTHFLTYEIIDGSDSSLPWSPEQLRQIRQSFPSIAVERRITKLVFFRLREVKGDASEWVNGLSTSLKDAKRRLEGDFNSLTKLDGRKHDGGAGPFECLGYLYLCCDFGNELTAKAYLYEAVAKDPQELFPQYYVHSKGIHKINIFRNKLFFEVVGSYFAQQEGALVCC